MAILMSHPNINEMDANVLVEWTCLVDEWTCLVDDWTCLVDDWTCLVGRLDLFPFK